MNPLIVTIDLDWACEPAIEETLDFLQKFHVIPTVFVTHRSPAVEAAMEGMDVGLHPYFAQDSSHGSTISETVAHIITLPHNIPAYRCHRFASCNISKLAMAEAGMKISSNVCTDLQTVPPFRDRFGLLEIPIFLEDGGYLWRKHALEISDHLLASLASPGIKVILIHPMHFAINTPYFAYMQEIKQSVSREDWHNLDQKKLEQFRWKGRGIRNLLEELIQKASHKMRLSDLL